jgi:hypothetical protein
MSKIEFFIEEIQCDREVTMPLHVLQKILELLLVLMVEKSGVTLLSNHLCLQKEPTGLEPSMLVLIDHQLLMLLVGQSINNNKLLVEEKSNSQGDVINQ